MQILIGVILTLLLPGLAQASTADDELLRALRSNDGVVQTLKARTVNVLAAVQEHRNTHFFPPEQRFEVFVTSPARRFTLTRMELRNGEQMLAEFAPDGNEIYALRSGGTAATYKGNVARGPFSLDVTLTGILPSGEEVRHSASMNLTKSSAPLALELRIRDSSGGSRVAIDALEREVRP